MGFYVSEEYFQNQKQNNSRETEKACDSGVYKVYPKAEAEKATEEIDNEQGHKAKTCVHKQLQNNPYGRCEDFEKQPAQQDKSSQNQQAGNSRHILSFLFKAVKKYLIICSG